MAVEAPRRDHLTAGVIVTGDGFKPPPARVYSRVSHRDNVYSVTLLGATVSRRANRPDNGPAGHLPARDEMCRGGFGSRESYYEKSRTRRRTRSKGITGATIATFPELLVLLMHRLDDWSDDEPDVVRS
ncbi:hypothetical protein AAE478_000638 [Parahypoxylon ruwenzoriense]